MFIFAHLFAGLLIGVGFWKISRDRRAVPLCALGAIFPDLLDKPLALLFPGMMGSGRTLGHALILILILGGAGLALWQYRRTLLGVAVACAVFSHQVLDAMWNLIATWLYPLFGPFPGHLIPDYVGHYFWIEITTASEWVFAGLSLGILVIWYQEMTDHVPLKPSRSSGILRVGTGILGIMGVCFLAAGLIHPALSLFAPTYNPATNVMAGLLSLCGCAVLLTWERPTHPPPSPAT